MRRLFWPMVAVWAVTALAAAGIARADMIKGKIVKIDGDTVTVKDDRGNEHRIHNDPSTTKRTGEVKEGAMVEADVTSMGHANAITVKTKEEKKETKKKTKEEKKEMKEEKK